MRRREVLAPYTTFRIGGPADLFFAAESPGELAAAVLAARAHGVPYFLLGLGANILVGDRGFRGLVIWNRARGMAEMPEMPEIPGRAESGQTAETPGPREATGSRDLAGPSGGRLLYAESGRLLYAESGAVVWPDLIEFAISRGLSGLEHYPGIPSTVGGALWQNLHFLSPAPARERTMFIAEVTHGAEILTAAGERRQVAAAYFEFGYDWSVLHERPDVVLAATFRLVPGDPERMREVVRENLAWRAARHPPLATEPSAGSIFKKIEGVGAGRLIDECGLKGATVGGAMITHRHANIIVNRGGATAADVRALIAHVQEAVLARTGQRLEPEISFVGEF